MQRAGAATGTQGVQHEHRHIGVKLFTILGHAEKTAMHGAGGGAQTGAAGLFKRLPRLEQRLLSHHPQAFDLLGVAIGVVDVPGS